MSNSPYGPPGYGGPPAGGPPGYGGPPAGGPPGYGGPPAGGPPGYGAPPGYGPPPAPLAPPNANPYAAPGAPAWAGPQVGSLPGGAMKWLFLAGWGGYWLFAVGGGVVSYLVTANGGSSDDAIIGSILSIVGVVFLLLVPVASMIWLYQAWNTVPPEMRYTDGGKWVTPGMAVGYCFIPFYNLYWIFVANVGLCDAINRTLLAKGGTPRAPKGLAIAACIGHLVPYCNLLASPILWTIYMFMLDGARKEMIARPAAA